MGSSCAASLLLEPDCWRNQAIALIENSLSLLGTNIVEPGFIAIAYALRFAATLENASNGQVFKKSSNAFEYKLPVVIFQCFHTCPECCFLENSARSPYKLPVAFGIDNQVEHLLWRW